MAYVLQVSDDELAVMVATMNAVDPSPFRHAERVAFYRLLVQFTRAYAKKNPNGFQLMANFGGIKSLVVLKARQRLAELET